MIPANKFPATPLAVSLQVDASLNRQVADVRQLQIALTPTARAANQINFSGHVDFSKTNAIQGNLKLAADSLDLTSYYDLFAGGHQRRRQTRRHHHRAAVRQCRPGAAGSQSAVAEFHAGGGHRAALLARSGDFQFCNDDEN